MLSTCLIFWAFLKICLVFWGPVVCMHVPGNRKILLTTSTNLYFIFVSVWMKNFSVLAIKMLSTCLIFLGFLKNLPTIGEDLLYVIFICIPGNIKFCQQQQVVTYFIFLYVWMKNFSVLAGAGNISKQQHFLIEPPTYDIESRASNK